MRQIYFQILGIHSLLKGSHVLSSISSYTVAIAVCNYNLPAKMLFRQWLALDKKYM